MKTIIFDFDGTIADILPELVKILNLLSADFGYKQIANDDIPRLRGLELRQSFKELGISNLKLPFLVRKVKSEIRARMSFVKPQKGIKSALLRLKRDGFSMGILTSNSRANIDLFLKDNGMDLFDFVYSGSSLFGKGRVLRHLLHSRQLRQRDVIYFGDELRDIAAARQAEVRVISVTWGSNSRNVLALQSPDALVNSPKELLTVIERFH